jgi:hypothetical protein
VAPELTVWIFFIFWLSKIHISLIGVVSFLFSPRCHLSSDRRCHAISRFLSLEPRQLAAFASYFGNALFRHLPSRSKIEVLNPHHRRRPPFLDSLTPTLHYYKKFISILITLPTTQLRLYFASSLVRASRHQSFTHHRRFLSPSSHSNRSSAQRQTRWWTSRPSFTSRKAYRHINLYKNIKLVINYLWIIYFIMIRI